MLDYRRLKRFLALVLASFIAIDLVLAFNFSTIDVSAPPSIMMEIILREPSTGVEESKSDKFEATVPASEILAKIERLEPIEYHNVIIKGDLDLTKLDLPTEQRIVPDVKKIYIELVLVDSSGNYKPFTSMLSTSLKIIKSPIKIIDSRIEGSVFFDNTIFNDSVIFVGTDFAKKAKFDGSYFNDSANFYRSRFVEGADFSRAEFRKNTNFDDVCFGGIVSFLESQFLEEAYFSRVQIKSRNFFTDSQFSKGADFSESQFNKTAHFDNSHFDGYANFVQSKFNEDAYFRDSNFNDAVCFNNSQFIGDVFFEGAIFKKNSTLFLTRAKLNKFYINWNNIYKLGYDDEVYLFLIENYKKLGWYEDADNCYYDYRIQRPIESLTSRIFDQGARLSYGYGVKPERPLIWSIIIILISGLFFYMTSGIQKSKSDSRAYKRITIGESIQFSATAFTSGASAFIYNPTDLTLRGKSRYVVTFERLLGWVFFALFLAALGRTLIR